MADGTVLVRQATNGDRPIDNVVVLNDLGDPVYRQRVAVGGEVRANPSPLTTLAQTQVAVTTTQVAVPATNLAGRTAISIEALAANGAEVYIGLSGVTTTSGRELVAGAAIDIDLAGTVQLYAVSASGTQRVSVTEVA